MKENLKLAVKIGGKIALTWAFTFGLGLMLTLLSFLIAYYSNNDVPMEGYSNGFTALFFGLLKSNIYAFLLVFGAPLFLIFYFITANKSSIQKAIYLLWKGDMGDYISDKVGKFAEHLTEKVGWKKELSNKAILKAKLLHENRTDPNSSKLQRKVINFGFKKIRLDDINFEENDLSLSGILTTKFNTFISESVKPSSKLFWIVILVQLALLIASIALV